MSHSTERPSASDIAPTDAPTGEPRGHERGGRPILGIALFTLALGGLTVVGVVPRLRQHAALAETRAALGGPRRVRAISVVAGPSTSELVLPGSSMPLRSTRLFAKSTGFLRQNRFEIGDHVKVGDVLADIDEKEIDQDILLAQVRLEEAKANLGIVQGTASRSQSLAEKGIASAQQAEEARAQANSAVAALKTRSAELQRIYSVRAYQTVTAPFDGVVVRRGFDPGAFVGPSSAGAVPLYEIADTGRLRVTIDVPQTFAPGIAAGLGVEVYSPETPQKVAAGKVVRSAGVLDSETRTLRTEIELPGDGAVLPGAFVYVRLKIPKTAPTMSIPAAALVVRKEGTLVAKLDGDKVKLVKVLLGRDDGKSLEVLSGLAAGDRLVVNVSDDLDDGMTVNVVEPKNEGKHDAP